MMLRLKTVSAKLLAVDRLRNEAEEALNLPALRLNQRLLRFLAVAPPGCERISVPCTTTVTVRRVGDLEIYKVDCFASLAMTVGDFDSKS